MVVNLTREKGPALEAIKVRSLEKAYRGPVMTEAQDRTQTLITAQLLCVFPPITLPCLLIPLSKLLVG